MQKIAPANASHVVKGVTPHTQTESSTPWGREPQRPEIPTGNETLFKKDSHRMGSLSGTEPILHTAATSRTEGAHDCHSVTGFLERPAPC